MKCSSCSGVMVSKALFTSSYWQCEQCEGKPKEEPKKPSLEDCTKLILGYDPASAWVTVWGLDSWVRDIDNDRILGSWAVCPSLEKAKEVWCEDRHAKHIQAYLVRGQVTAVGNERGLLVGAGAECKLLETFIEESGTQPH
jgi:hypothetical protein